MPPKFLLHSLPITGMFIKTSNPEHKMTKLENVGADYPERKVNSI